MMIIKMPTLYNFLMILLPILTIHFTFVSGAKVDFWQNNKSTFLQTPLWHFLLLHHFTPNTKHNSALFNAFTKTDSTFESDAFLSQRRRKNTLIASLIALYVVTTSIGPSKFWNFFEWATMPWNIHFSSLFTFALIFVSIWISFVAFLCYELWCLKFVFIFVTVWISFVPFLCYELWCLKFVFIFVSAWISFVAFLCYELWCLKTVSLARLSD